MSSIVYSNRAWMIVAVFLGALAWYAVGWHYGAHGGESTVGAERVLAGQIPHRDFWTIYASGHFYVLALLFRIFGTHLLVEVVAASIVCAIAACVCYSLAFNLVGRRWAALFCAGVYVAATYNTNFFASLSTYPLVSLCVLTALHFMVDYWRAAKPVYLIASGLATGAAVAFKHDVAGYTAVAIGVGLVAHQLLTPGASPGRIRQLLTALATYAAAAAVVALPLVTYFAVVAGSDVLRNLIIFPLTEFRFARPEGYPSLFHLDISDPSRLQMLFKVFDYLMFALPFGVFLVSLLAAVWALRWRRWYYVPPIVTFCLGFLFHYSAAHVQINTHIISMSVYAALLAVLLYDMLDRAIPARYHGLSQGLAVALALGWFLVIASRPIYNEVQLRKFATAELTLPKLSGFMVGPQEAEDLERLAAVVNSQSPPGQPLFVGLHRHDVVITSDMLLYFALDRPSATRYHELHPAIADTARVQQEIIRDLQAKNVSLLVLKRIFSDEQLEEAKRAFQQNLPLVGATDLDEFIRQHYVEIERIGPYSVWKRGGS